MKILNVMFGKGLGGIEQAFVDYARALEMRGHEVINIIHPDAQIRRTLDNGKLHIHPIMNYGEWDPFALRTIRRMVDRLRPDLAILHGNRATGLFLRAAKGKIPLVGVAQNYKTKRFMHTDAVLTTTKDLVRHLQEEEKIPAEKIFQIPNMVDLPPGVPRNAPRTPPVIGTLGRFVTKKGFDDYIRALGQLNKSGVAFRALLAGDGEQKSALMALAREEGVNQMLEFPGWVQDKDAFFRSIDIFVLPSLHEPFGIVLIEAMGRGLPSISTRTEGPEEIITNGQDGLLVPCHAPEAIAGGLQKILSDLTLYSNLSVQAIDKVQLRYTLSRISPLLDTALKRVLENK